MGVVERECANCGKIRPMWYNAKYCYDCSISRLMNKRKWFKESDYKKIASIIKPIVRRWSELDEKVVKNNIYAYYLLPRCKLKKLCEYLGVSQGTLYTLFNKYGLPRKHEKLSKEISLAWKKKLNMEID